MSDAQEEEPASAGPSKNAQKKAAKLASKAARKTGGASSTSPPTTSKSPPATSAAPAAAPKATPLPVLSDPLMYLNSDGPGPLKCVAAARLFGVKVDAAAMNPAGETTRESETNGSYPPSG